MSKTRTPYKERHSLVRSFWKRSESEVLALLKAPSVVVQNRFIELQTCTNYSGSCMECLG